MEGSEVFGCKKDMEMNGRCSFKSLLLEGEEMDGVGIDGGQLVLTGDMEVVEQTLYTDDIMAGRESFKSLLMAGEDMEEDEVHFSPRDGNVGNGNEVHYSDLPTTAQANLPGTEEVGSISMDYQGVDYVDQHVVDSAEVVIVEETNATRRKGKRYEDNIPAVEEESNLSTFNLVRLEDPGCIPEHGPELVLQSEPLSSLPLPPPLGSLPRSKRKKQADSVKILPPSKKKKLGTFSDVQKLLDSVIARQEIFFTDLLESMERKEEIRERIRQEKEEKWRAEERAQTSVFNNAMFALTQELLSDSVQSSQLTDKSK